MQPATLVKKTTGLAPANEEPPSKRPGPEERRRCYNYISILIIEIKYQTFSKRTPHWSIAWDLGVRNKMGNWSSWYKAESKISIRLKGTRQCRPIFGPTKECYSGATLFSNTQCDSTWRCADISYIILYHRVNIVVVIRLSLTWSWTPREHYCHDFKKS